ncbi:macro domain-containing protein [Achromobacter dolens]|uniref:type II toxin-antitoxin system antitoxin DNA ADP-ribosyl glycohydrolase DarG n=1 Tax=Achromobacter dolens TaxID=1287738 RepID=UPI0022B8E21E|nr:macro domain-containing protein [Achromobacter dolens]MCZ8408143.1 macro domain-containing protein [Achromobacter dolens]
MSIEVKSGDLLRQEGIDAIVNTVNCVGVMGKGIALQFKQKWPENFEAYRLACSRGEVKLGSMFVYDSGGLVKPNFIVNFPTKGHWKERSRLTNIEAGLHDLVERIRQLQIRSIAIPPLGCGNGGLDWAVVKPLIEDVLTSELPEVTVYLFEPGSTPRSKDMETRTKKPRMTRARAALVKLLEVYKELGYGLSKIEVQKLAYFLQCSGEDMGLTFLKHEFGPYSDQLRHALQRMEGHYIRGLGDGVSAAEIEPMPQAIGEASEYLRAAGNSDLDGLVERVGSLIEGFQSPYGMELLATVHWISSHDPSAKTPEDVLEIVQDWNERKRRLMTLDHVRVAWQRLKEDGWLEGAYRTANA